MSQMDVDGFVEGAKTRVCEFVDLVQQLRGDLEAVYSRNVPCKYPNNLDINMITLGEYNMPINPYQSPNILAPNKYD
jgi:hypothetical protein